MQEYAANWIDNLFDNVSYALNWIDNLFGYGQYKGKVHVFEILNLFI